MTVRVGAQCEAEAASLTATPPHSQNHSSWEHYGLYVSYYNEIAARAGFDIKYT